MGSFPDNYTYTGPQFLPFRLSSRSNHPPRIIQAPRFPGYVPGELGVRKIHMKTFLLFVIISILAAEDTVSVTLVREVAKENEKIEEFAIHGIGYSGERTIMAELIEGFKDNKHAEAVYLRLSNSGSLSEALYGLYGLALIKSKSYNDASERISKLPGKVLLGPGGCIVHYANAVEVSKYIAENVLQPNK